MPVPTFTLLTAAQFDPGKPMTQEIGLALWRNWMAVLGVDDTDASPNLTYGPGMLRTAETTGLSIPSTGTTTDTAEFIVSDLAAGFETNTQEGGKDDATEGQYNIRLQDSGGGYLHLKLCGLDAHYASGSPDGITISVVQIGGRTMGGTGPLNGLAANQSASYLIASDNAWKVLVNDGSVDILQAKARETATHLYLTLRIAPSGGGRLAAIHFTNVRRTFLYKG